MLLYQNQGATRNQPLSPQLAQALGFLGEMGVEARVFSGGQPASGGGPRVGSTRHDHGNAADVLFYQNGRQLDWSNPDDLPVFQQIVQRGRENGITGFGAGPGYMQPGSMHIGFGQPAVWGAGGRSANAPEWLRQAYYGAATNPDQQIANDAMRAIGQPVAETRDRPMMQGLLGTQQSAPRQEAPQAQPKWYQNPDVWDRLTLALNSMRMDPDQGLAQAVNARMGERSQQAQQQQQVNAQAEWLRQNGRPDLAEAVERGIIGGGDAFGAMQPRERDVIEVNGQLVDRQTGQVVGDYRSPDQISGGGTEYGLTPQYGVDANGNPVLIQLGKNGEAIQTPLPDGVSLSREPIRIDAGTEIILLDPITRQPIGKIPKNNRQAAADTAGGAVEGRAQAEAAVGAGANIAQAEQSIALIDSIMNDPALSGITGMIQGRIPPMTQDGVDLNTKITQLQGQAFLEAFESLKGGGAITEREGQAATEAMARLNRAQSDTAYREALAELRGILARGRDRAAQAGGNQAAPTGGGAGPTVLRYNPATGDFE